MKEMLFKLGTLIVLALMLLLLACDWMIFHLRTMKVFSLGEFPHKQGSQFAGQK